MKNNNLKGAAIVLLSILTFSCAPKDSIDSLMRKMTLEEKIGQLNQITSGQLTGTTGNSNQNEKIRDGQVGCIINLTGAARIREMQRIAVEESRLGIPLLFAYDVIHGYNEAFPIPLAMSCSWDIDGIERACRIAATEASASGVCWNFAPMCDIARDPRWGRIAEGAGEDPYLGGCISAAQVRGFQGALDDSTCIASTVKHFALYGAPVAGRDYAASEMSRQQMFNEYLQPYQKALEAGALSTMSSFNEYEGLPITLNKYMLTDVLKKRIGFEGLLVTDYKAIKECIAHGAVEDMLEGSVKAIKAGVDMDMVDEAFLNNLAEAVSRGLVKESEIDRCCRQVLKLKERLGLFENPYKFCREEEEAMYETTRPFRSESRTIAAESIVLLKNDGDVLPLREGSRIALVGPLGNLPKEMLGAWYTRCQGREEGRVSDPVSLYEGLCTRFGSKNVSFSIGSRVIEDRHVIRQLAQTTEGMGLERSEESLLAEALRNARNADVIVAAMGEFAYMSGEGCSRADITIPECQRKLLRELVKIGKPVVLVTMAGRPLVLDWESENVPAIVNAWHLGSEAGDAIADILSGDVNPSGRLTVSIPRMVGQIPVFYNHKNTGRPIGDHEKFRRYMSCYCDCLNSPQYPFGYGLSYSKISYSDLALSADSLSISEMPLKVTATITNESDRDAVEVAQLYIHDKAASITRPVKELKRFARVNVPAGQSTTVEFELCAEDLGFVGYSLDFVIEPGDFDIMVGANSDNSALLKKQFKLL